VSVPRAVCLAVRLRSGPAQLQVGGRHCEAGRLAGGRLQLQPAERHLVTAAPRVAPVALRDATLHAGQPQRLQLLAELRIDIGQRQIGRQLLQLRALDARPQPRCSLRLREPQRRRQQVGQRFECRHVGEVDLRVQPPAPLGQVAGALEQALLEVAAHIDRPGQAGRRPRLQCELMACQRVAIAELQLGQLHFLRHGAAAIDVAHGRIADADGLLVEQPLQRGVVVRRAGPRFEDEAGHREALRRQPLDLQFGRHQGQRGKAQRPPRQAAPARHGLHQRQGQRDFALRIAQLHVGQAQLRMETAPAGIDPLDADRAGEQAAGLALQPGAQLVDPRQQHMAGGQEHGREGEVRHQQREQCPAQRPPQGCHATGAEAARQ